VVKAVSSGTDECLVPGEDGLSAMKIVSVEAWWEGIEKSLRSHPKYQH
jgi:hypothetical protein